MKTDVKKALEDFYRDKIIESELNFQKIGDKETGITSGYVGKRNIDNAIFMIKPALKESNFADIDSTQIEVKREEKDDFVREYLSAPLFRRFLYDRAPIIELVADDDLVVENTIEDSSKPRQLSIRSKFLNDFQPLDIFMQNNKDKLKQIQGLEKVIAACMFMGDSDYHGENIGIVTVTLEDDSEEYVATKIDHGKAFCMFYNDESLLRKQLFMNVEGHGYDSLPINVSKLKDAVDEIIKVSEDEIENLLKARIFNLQQSGFKLNSNLWYFHDDNVVDTEINGYEDLEKIYVKKCKEQLTTLKKLSGILDIITKIDMPEHWKEKKWLEHIIDLDPIAWAISKNKTIEGYDALSWAISHNKEIEGLSPKIWQIKQEKINRSLDDKIKGNKIDGKDPIIWARDNEICIQGIEPIAWAVKNNHAINGDSPWKWAIQNLDITDVSSLIQNNINNKSFTEDILAVSQAFNQTTGQKYDVLSPILASYCTMRHLAKQGNREESSQQLIKLENMYNEIITNMYPNRQILNIDSNIGKAIKSDPIKFAKMFSAYSHNVTSDNIEEETKLTPQHVMHSMTLPLLYEMINVNKYSEEDISHSSRNIGQVIHDALNNIIYTVRNMFGKNLSEKKFHQAMEDLNNFQSIKLDDKYCGDKNIVSWTSNINNLVKAQTSKTR